MQITTSKMLTELDNQLNFIKAKSINKLQNAEFSIEITIKSIEKLKEFIIKHNFQNEKEEITFFKKIKPEFISRFVFQTFVFSIETKRPNGCSKNVRNFLKDELKKSHYFYEKNLEFCKYYRSGCEHLDHQYFVRGKFDIKISLDNLFGVIDERFCSHHDLLVAQIIANTQIEEYLKNEIEILDNIQNPTAILKTSQAPTLNWSAPKTALIELLYALHADGCFNNGNANISQIAAVFEAAFNIDLSQSSRIFLDISSRKMGKTKYLDSLVVKLIKKMNDANPDL